MDARISALKERIGITRLANITGLDRLGYPVVAAVRPCSLNLSVSFGKGPTSEIANLSAVMEAAELYFSECPPHPLVLASYAELVAGSAINPFHLRPMDIGSDLGSVPFEWVWGSSLTNKQSVLVPWDLISMDYSMAAREKKRRFEFGATGLAADFDETSAVLHGLYEVIERDCHNEWNLTTDDRRGDTLVDLESVTCPIIRRQLGKIQAAGFNVLAWDMTGRTNIPCYLVEVCDLTPGVATAYVQGAAANLSANAAIQMALSEALQIRLTYISGSRDDLEWSDYGARYSEIVENREGLLSNSAAVRTVPVEQATKSHTSALAEILKRLDENGFGDVVVVPLTNEGDPVHVVKVVVPLLRDIQDIDPSLTMDAAEKKLSKSLSSKPVVFLGPTLTRVNAKLLCDADFRAPAAMGDITRAACEKPEVIVLIDGVFEDRPSVWHKEILWAMSEGVAVIGASSMGALRASELDEFGMLGYGEVYEDYASGRLADDDEVAVVHGPEETNWMPFTDAMVDIRHSVYCAKMLRLLSDGEATRLIELCKSQFFKSRSLSSALETILPETRTFREIAEIKHWFSSRPVGVKERDCRSLLADIKAQAAAAQNLLHRAPHFTPTIYLSRLYSFGFHVS